MRLKEHMKCPTEGTSAPVFNSYVCVMLLDCQYMLLASSTISQSRYHVWFIFNCASDYSLVVRENTEIIICDKNSEQLQITSCVVQQSIVVYELDPKCK